MLKLIKLILLFCVGERSVQRGARSGLMLSSMHEGTSGYSHEESRLFNPFAKENLGCPLQALNGDNSLLFRGAALAGPQPLLHCC